MTTKALSEKQKIINDICIYLNRQILLSDFAAIEVNPSDAELTIVFSRWFSKIFCVKGFDSESDYIPFLYDLRDENNVNIIAEDSANFVRKFADELVPAIFLHDNTERDVFDWSQKIIKGGFLLGDNVRRLPKFVKVDKMIGKYWIARRV